MLRLKLDEIETLAHGVLVGSGASEAQAGPVAESVRDAEAEGLRNVGLAYLPYYCEHLSCGKINGHAEPVLSRLAAATMRVDADHGFAHAAFISALDEFVLLVDTNGVATMSITNSYSVGVLGWFMAKLAERNIVSLGFANSSALMPAWGGSSPFFGTNPLAFGAPRHEACSVVFDMATSATARVNVMDLAARGEPIPEGWALDSHGQPTTDPLAAANGMNAPLGGAKGAGLALMVDVLAAGLTGSNFSFESSSFLDNEGGPPSVGQFFVGFAPTKTGSPNFGGRMETLASALEAQSGVRLPGARRTELRLQAESVGLEVPEELLESLERYRL